MNQPVLFAGLTQYQIFRLVREATGVSITLKPFECLERAIPDETSIRLLIKTHKINPLITRIRLEKTGYRLVALTLTNEGWRVQTLVVWNDEVPPQVILEWGKVTSVAEACDRRVWENLSYRWGNARRPLDSYTRQCQGYDYSYHQGRL